MVIVANLVHMPSSRYDTDATIAAPTLAGRLQPETSAVYRTLGGVLDQYSRRQGLVQELLAAAESSRREEEAQSATMR